MFRRSLAVVGATVLGAWLALTIVCVYLVFVKEQSMVYYENGLLENLQAVLLVVSCLIFFLTALMNERNDKLILLACALLCYGFFLREVDVERLDVHAFLVLIGSGMGRNLILLLATILILVVAIRNFAHYWQESMAYLRSPVALLFLLSAVTLFTGAYFEDANALPHHEFFEEGLELLAYVLILLASLAARKLVREPAQVALQTAEQTDLSQNDGRI
ncbi:hypothetical protein [Nitrincola sp. MINF-07-Sa-05]|uniref:hypothetical protein n=1 Tax=Nitrincola salilacus TaxID=3400273 RepID=UPI0039182FDD